MCFNNPMKKTSLHRSAFTLIEMAMVLIIMGIIVGSSAKIFVSMSKNAKVTQTKELLKLMALDIEGFATTFGRLPTSKEFESFRMRTKDAWGKPIVYLGAKKLFKTICSQTKTDFEQHQNKKVIKNQAFALVSSGANRNKQTATLIGQVRMIKSAAMSKAIDFDSSHVDRIEPYDDIYLFRSLWMLKAQLKCKEGARP